MSAPEHENDGSDWLTPRHFGLILGLLVVAAFPQVIFGRETFAGRDFGYFGYPLAYYFRESFWRGEIPLWNPLNDCGIPFLAQWNTQVLYPPAIFYLVFPLSWSLGVFCLLHLWLGGMGMFFLARRWTGNAFAAAVAGIIFAFNGLMLNSVLWPATIPGLGWMPWVVLLVERAWHDGGKSLVIAAVAGALQLLSGAAEVVMLTWALLAAIALGEIFFGDSSRDKIILRFGIIVAIITGLCAAQLLPFFELLKNSNRQENFNAAQWAMPLSGFGNFLEPLFRCRNVYGSVFEQPGQYWTSSYYVGIVTLAFAFVAFLRKPSWRAWLLGAALLFCLILALGNVTPIYKLATRVISPLSVMRFPVKFVILPVFILPLLAAFGLAPKSSDQNAQNTFSKIFWLSSACLLASLFAIVWLGSKSPRPQENWTATWHNAFVRAASFIAAIGVLFITKKISAPKLRLLCQLLALLLVWVDLLTHIPQSKTVRLSVYTDKMVRSSSSSAASGRAMISQWARRYYATSGAINPETDYLVHRWALFSNCNLLEDIPKVDGFFPLYPREHIDILSLLLSETNRPSAGLLDFVGVSMITSSNILPWEVNVPGWDARESFLPLITGGQKPVFADTKTTLRALAGTNFSPRTEVYLPADVAREISVTNQSTVLIGALHVSAGDGIETKVIASVPAFIVVSQTFYPTWKAFLDGKPARLFRANHAFQAVQVPSGKHDVKLVYSDGKFYFGAIISLATLGSCIGFALQKKRGH
jgi:hypothetical protein